jgi:hypothetical protein
MGKQRLAKVPDLRLDLLRDGEGVEFDRLARVTL